MRHIPWQDSILPKSTWLGDRRFPFYDRRAAVSLAVYL